MSYFKNIVLSLLLVVPIVGAASTTTSFESVVGSSVAGLDSYDGTNGTTVNTSSSDTFFVDLWTLDIGENDLASITFKASDTSVSVGSKNVDIFKISPFNVTTLGNYGLTDLGTGSYHFLISGKSEGIAGGLYLVGTAISAVPLPAAVWLFGSALLVVLSISKRKHQI